MMHLNWLPMGQIFTCQTHLPPQFVSHAQSPQALVLDDCVRIYFSTRQKDSDGKFLSHVCYADYDKALHIKAVADHNIIPLGRLGTFDEHGIFPFSPFHHDGRIMAYTCGWSRRVAVDVETATGFAESFDGGQTFQKTGDGEIFGASLHEPMLIGDSFVRHFNGQYHMWYMVGHRWVRETEGTKPDRVYKIGHAVSDDGVNCWQRDNRQIIPDKLHDNECQALPSVLYHNGLYHMVFCYRDVYGFRTDPAKAYRIGYAWSIDARHWVRDDAAGGLTDPQGDWDRDMMAYPHLTVWGDDVYCLYNGNAFGRDGFGAVRLDQSGLIRKHNHATAQDILDHFHGCGEDFRQDLSDRVDIQVYAEKLAAKAERFEIWDGDRLIGLNAVYFNAAESFAFITHIGTTQKGLGQDLLQYAEGWARVTGLRDLRLEVSETNTGAIAFYKKHGFIKTENGLWVKPL